MSSDSPHPVATVATAPPEFRRKSDARARIDVGQRAASLSLHVCPETRRALRVHYSNVLLVASPSACEEPLTALISAGRPLVAWCDGARPVLPRATVGTLVLKNPAVQIITVTPEPLYPLVQVESILAELYFYITLRRSPPMQFSVLCLVY